VPVRLTGGRSSSAGRLEIYHNGVFAAVHAYSLNDPHALAAVACRQLGYTDQLLEISDQFAQFAQFAPRNANPEWQSVDCSGSEASVAECSFGSSYWAGNNDELGLACYNASAVGEQLGRLVLVSAGVVL
jgi:hypothetical protein